MDIKFFHHQRRRTKFHDFSSSPSTLSPNAFSRGQSIIKSMIIKKNENIETKTPQNMIVEIWAGLLMSFHRKKFVTILSHQDVEFEF